MWVSPFRYPRIIKYLLLPVAFRSLSRLSSALSAKASTLRSYQLNLLTLGAGLLPPSTSIALDAQVLVHNFGFFIYLNEVFGKSLDFPPDNTCVFWYLLFWMSLSFIDLDLEHLFNCCIRFSRYRFGSFSAVDNSLCGLINASHLFVVAKLRLHVASHYNSM